MIRTRRIGAGVYEMQTPIGTASIWRSYSDEYRQRAAWYVEYPGCAGPDTVANTLREAKGYVAAYVEAHS
ncbi:MAG: hypothetical protein ACOC9T_00105 [Myxococcota bacterium]